MLPRDPRDCKNVQEMGLYRGKSKYPIFLVEPISANKKKNKGGFVVFSVSEDRFLSIFEVNLNKIDLVNRVKIGVKNVGEDQNRDEMCSRDRDLWLNGLQVWPNALFYDNLKNELFIQFSNSRTIEDFSDQNSGFLSILFSSGDSRNPKFDKIQKIEIHDFLSKKQTIFLTRNLSVLKYSGMSDLSRLIIQKNSFKKFKIFIRKTSKKRSVTLIFDSDVNTKAINTLRGSKLMQRRPFRDFQITGQIFIKNTSIRPSIKSIIFWIEYLGIRVIIFDFRHKKILKNRLLQFDDFANQLHRETLRVFSEALRGEQRVSLSLNSQMNLDFVHRSKKSIFFRDYLFDSESLIFNFMTEVRVLVKLQGLFGGSGPKFGMRVFLLDEYPWHNHGLHSEGVGGLMRRGVDRERDSGAFESSLVNLVDVRFGDEIWVNKAFWDDSQRVYTRICYNNGGPERGRLFVPAETQNTENIGVLSVRGTLGQMSEMRSSKTPSRSGSQLVYLFFTRDGLFLLDLKRKVILAGFDFKSGFLHKIEKAQNKNKRKAHNDCDYRYQIDGLESRSDDTRAVLDPERSMITLYQIIKPKPSEKHGKPNETLTRLKSFPLYHLDLAEEKPSYRSSQDILLHSNGFHNKICCKRNQNALVCSKDSIFNYLYLKRLKMIVFAYTAKERYPKKKIRPSDNYSLRQEPETGEMNKARFNSGANPTAYTELPKQYVLVECWDAHNFDSFEAMKPRFFFNAPIPAGINDLVKEEDQTQKDFDKKRKKSRMKRRGKFWFPFSGTRGSSSKGLQEKISVKFSIDSNKLINRFKGDQKGKPRLEGGGQPERVLLSERSLFKPESEGNSSATKDLYSWIDVYSKPIEI